MHRSDRTCMRSVLEAQKKVLKRWYVLCPLLQVRRTNILDHLQVAALGTRWSSRNKGHQARLRRRSARFTRLQTPMPSARWRRLMSPLTPPRQSESAKRRSPVGPCASSSIVSPSRPRNRLPAQHESQHASQRAPERRKRGRTYFYGSARSFVRLPRPAKRSGKRWSRSDQIPCIHYIVAHTRT
jgi:hypothetical protein